MTRIAANPLVDTFYLLDDHNLEVIAVGGSGQITGRYGGWGGGAQAFDLPRELLFAENSLFVLDEGKNQIIRLDANLNPVAVTPLPEDRRPLAFARDGQQRFWVLFENVTGAYIFNDDGDRLDIVGDEAGGGSAVLDPYLLGYDNDKLAIWDRDRGELAMFRTSGSLAGRFPFPEQFEPDQMAVTDSAVFLLNETHIKRVNLESRRYSDLNNIGHPQAISKIPGGLVTMDSAGIIRVFKPAK